MSTHSASAQTAGPATNTATLQFAELVCGDPALLRAEFDELIAASWDGPPPRWPFGPRRSPPHRPCPLPDPARHNTASVRCPAQRTGVPTARSRQRGPP